MKVFYSLSPKVKDLVYKCRKRGTLPIYSYRGSGKPLGNKQESPRLWHEHFAYLSTPNFEFTRFL